MTSDIKVVVDSSDLQLLSRDLADIPKKAKDSASVFEREFNKVERQLNKTATASQSYYSEILKIDQQSKSAAASASVFESALKQDEIATKKLATEKERLAGKYKPLYAASKQYERALEEINRAQKLGVLSDQQRSTSIEQLNRDFQQGTGIFTQHSNIMNKQAARNGVILQQAGYQVGDFAVQVQSGTNPMVAFGQQATQMVGALYLLPPALLATKVGILGLKVSVAALVGIVGVVLPIASALALALMSLKRSSKEAESPTMTLKDAMKDLGDKTKTTRQELDLLNSSLANSSELMVSNEILRLERERAKVEAEILDLQKKGGSQASRQLHNVHRPRLSKINDELVIQQDILENYKESGRFLKSELSFHNDILGSEKGLAQETEALNSLYESRLGTIDDTANDYVDILGSEQGLSQATAALNSVYESRLGTIDDTANTYIDILGSAEGLLAAEQALNEIYESRLGTIDDTANNYVDILGSVEGLAKATEALNQIDAAALKAEEAAKRKAEREQELKDREKLRQAIKKQNEETQKLKNTADQLAAPFDTAFMSIVDGTKSVQDAFKSMAAEIIKELYRIFVVKKITGMISGAIQGYMAGPVKGPNLPSGNYDGGGYTGSGPRSGGLDGKGGFMAMLHPRETVVDHTKGQSAGSTVVNQTFNISANTSDDTKRLITQTIAQASPAIINQSVGAVMNQRRRGGSMKSAFG